MKVGLFDHVERADRSLATLYDERLTFAAAADDAGIYCLHVAEHHHLHDDGRHAPHQH